MSSKKKAQRPASRPAAASSPAAEPAAAAPRPDRKPWVFAVLDVLFAILYIGVTSLAHSSDGRFETGTQLMGVALLAAAVGVAVRKPWGWAVSLAGCAFVLLGALVLLVLLASSAAFLWGTFGALGKGAASMSLIMMALIVEVYVLVPAFQVAYLLSERGRRTAGRPVRAVPVDV
jgi:hypothetical protein